MMRWIVAVLSVALALAPAVQAAPVAALRGGQPRQTGQAVVLQAGLEEVPLPAEIAGDPVALDTCRALREVLQQALGYSPARTDALIRQHAEAAGAPMTQLLHGVLDAPETEGPSDEEFDELLYRAEVLFESGGNGGRGLREIARVAGVQAISDVPVDDDGGNYGVWREEFRRRFNGRFILSLGGDVANVRAEEASSPIRHVMADRVSEKPAGGWPPAETVRGLLIHEMVEALRAFAAQHPNDDPADDPLLVRSLATVISAHRILTEAFPALLKTDVLSKASGQNLLGVAIAVRSGFLSPRTGRMDSTRLKRALLLWNRALGLDGRAGLVIPNSLDGVRPYFVYADQLALEPVRLPGRTELAAVRFGESNIPPDDVFTVTQSDEQLILTDGFGRRLQYEAAELAYVARDKGTVETRFERFPAQIERAIRERLRAVLAVSLVRGEYNASEERSWYEGTSVLAWGAEYPAGEKAPDISPPMKVLYDAVLSGRARIRTIVIGLGSEGTSIALHFWRPERVRFLAELARRRRAGQTVPRVVFVFNPAETNDSYTLGPAGIIEHYEMVFRQSLGDDAVRLEDLIPEIVLCRHDHPWVVARNPAVAQEMGTSLDAVDYAHLLGPLAPDEHYGLVHRSRRAMPSDTTTLDELSRRFAPAAIHVGPYADVRGTVVSSAGETRREAQVQMLTHRLGAVLFPERRGVLLPVAVREERRIFHEKFQRDPTDEELAEFLNQVGYQTTAQEVQAISAGLEEPPLAKEPVAQLVDDIRRFFAGPAAVPPAEFQPGMGLVVDLATGFESDALAALMLPRGAVVIVGTEALLKAEQLANRTAMEQGIITVRADRGPDGAPAALRVAVAWARGEVGKTVRIYSGLPTSELGSILNDVAAGSVELNGGLTVEQILERLRPGDDAVSAFLALLGRARHEWHALREYV